jgi:uncharacterized protein with GYD domain
MATFVTLVNLTEQGAKNFKATPDRGEKFKAIAQKAGVTVKEMYWTMGRYDVVMILEGPDDKTVAGVLAGLASLGNVKTQTMRGFSAAEMKEIFSKMPS